MSKIVPDDRTTHDLTHDIDKVITVQHTHKAHTPLPYSRFNQAKQIISGIEAIDYFFAKEVCTSLWQQVNDTNKFDALLSNNLFHLCLALSAAFRDGHTCLPIDTVAGKLWGQGFSLPNTDSNQGADMESASTKSQATQKIASPNIQDGFQFASQPILTSLLVHLSINPEHQQLIVYQQSRLYIRRYFVFEQRLSSAIIGRLTESEFYEQQHIVSCLDSLFPPCISGNNEAPSIDWQKVAVANAINKRFSVIAGGPGTGKTYTVTKLLAALVMLEQHIKQPSTNQNNKALLNIALVAPTGKAAQRLSESIVNAVSGFAGLIAQSVLMHIPKKAETIHRLLGVVPNSPNFKHHVDNRLPYDVVLVDEVSMVDLPLMTRLINAVKDTTKIILLGDADQLPSVAAGSILADIAPRPHQGFSDNNRNYLNTVCRLEPRQLAGDFSAKTQQQSADYLTFLTKSRRFDGQGGIGLLAKAVISGDNKGSWSLLTRINCDDSPKSKQELTLAQGELGQWLTPLVKQYYRPIADATDVQSAFALLGKFRVLCATRHGAFGVEAINELIKSLLGKNKTVLQQQTSLYHGQPIMITENDYRLGLFNGDIGIIWRHVDSLGKSHLMANFENTSSTNHTDAIKTFIPSRLPSFETVYAMTIHKTQGSEFSHVAMAISATNQDHKAENRGSKLLSRELLYTGITRAKSLLTVAVNKKTWYQGVSAQVKRYSGLCLSERSKQC